MVEQSHLEQSHPERTQPGHRLGLEATPTSTGNVIINSGSQQYDGSIIGSYTCSCADGCECGDQITNNTLLNVGGQYNDTTCNGLGIEGIYLS
jgi:hypothetical protein